MATRATKTTIILHILAALVVVMWGVSFVSTKVVLDHHIGPITIYVARFCVAYLLMWIVTRRVFALNLRDELLLAICGLCGSTVYYLAENFALKYTLASNVSLITSMSPILTLLLLGLIYKSERPSKGALIGSAIAFMGVGLVIFNSSFEMEGLHINPLGDLLSLAAALAFAMYTLILRKLHALYDVAFITRKTFFYGIVTSIPFVVFSPEEFFTPEWLDGTVIANFVFLTVGCTILAFLVWGWAVGGLGAVKTNNYLYFQPVVTLIFSAIFLHEAITVIGIAGTALILLGVVLCDKLDMRAKMKK